MQRVLNIFLAEIDAGEKTEHYRVVVDGTPRDHMLKLTPGRQTVELARGLDPGQPHTVSLMKETYHGGDTIFHGFHTDSAMVSRMLGAEMHLQAVGGATLAGPGTNTVRSFIFSRERGQPDPNYRSGFQPDVIVVNARANDISRSRRNGPSTARYSRPRREPGKPMSC